MLDCALWEIRIVEEIFSNSSGSYRALDGYANIGKPRPAERFVIRTSAGTLDLAAGWLKFFRKRADNKDMEEMRFKRGAARRKQLGFTLPEVMITIVLIGIVMAIASSTWFGVVESRRVDSAANQLAADLRLAHTNATNRLENWQVVLTHNSSSYQFGSAAALQNRTFCGAEGCDSGDPRVNISGGGTATITFRSNGSASVAPSGSTTFTVTVDGNPSRNVELTPATSRIKIV